jgi:hypothetical protein
MFEDSEIICELIDDWPDTMGGHPLDQWLGNAPCLGVWLLPYCEEAQHAWLWLAPDLLVRVLHSGLTVAKVIQDAVEEGDLLGDGPLLKVQGHVAPEKWASIIAEWLCGPGGHEAPCELQ